MSSEHPCLYNKFVSLEKSVAANMLNKSVNNPLVKLKAAPEDIQEIANFMIILNNANLVAFALLPTEL